MSGRLGVAAHTNNRTDLSMRLVQGNSGLGDVQLSPAVSNEFLRNLFGSFINTRQERGEQLWTTMWKNKNAVENWGGTLPDHEQKILDYWNSKDGQIPLAFYDFQSLYPGEFARLKEAGKLYEKSSQQEFAQDLIQQAQELQAQEEQKRQQLITEYNNDLQKGQALLSQVSDTLSQLSAARQIVSGIRNSPFKEFRDQANNLFGKIQQVESSLGNTKGQLEDTVQVIQQKLNNLN